MANHHQDDSSLSWTHAIRKRSPFAAADPSKPPIGLRWRSNTFFIVAVVGVAQFTDLFLYGLIVPVIPFLLQDRLHVPGSQIQNATSALLAVYAGASCVMAPVAGVLADKLLATRQLPFLSGLVLLLLSTILLTVGQTFPMLVIARLLQGASGGLLWTLALAMLIETVGQENLGKTIGSIFSFVSVAGLLSPVIGGVLYAKSGYTGVFALGLSLIAIDFILRVLMIEKKVAARYMASTPASQPDFDADSESDVGATDESSPLLSRASPDLSHYQIAAPKSGLTKSLPILLLFSDPGLLTAQFIGFLQAILLGSFDTTVPLVASDLYGFNSLKAGLLFLPLGASDFFLGPAFGWCVDRWGTKPIAVAGFAFLVPSLILLRIPTEVATSLQFSHQIAIYASLLGLNGVGMAMINSPSIVESGAIMEKYAKANPKIFGEDVPYAQLYGINSLIWNLGLSVGPLLAGALRQSIGYGNMNAVLASISGLTAVLAALFVGGKPKTKSQGGEGGANGTPGEPNSP